MRDGLDKAPQKVATTLEIQVFSRPLRTPLATMKRLLFVVCLIAAGGFSAVWGLRGPSSNTQAVEAYEARLAAHPALARSPMPREAWRAIPKKDRPDLAWELDELLTMDPATGSVPRERLWAANRVVAQARSRAGGPLLTEAWAERGPTNVAGRTRAVLFDPSDATGRRVWAGGVAGGLWRTDDITSASAVWTGVDDFWANLAVSALAADPTDAQVLYAGTGEGWGNGDALQGAGVFRSTDGGTTWARLPSTASVPAFRYVMDLATQPGTGVLLASTRDGGVYRSTNRGDTWERVLGAGTGIGGADAHDLEVGADGRFYAAFGRFSTPGGLYASVTGAVGTWQKLNTGTNGFPASQWSRLEVAPAPSDPQVIYVAAMDPATSGVGAMYRTSDAGITWTEIPRPTDVEYGPNYARQQAWYDLSLGVDPSDANTVLTGGINVFRSTTGGASWTQLSHWYGGFGYPYVHADQHAIAFRPGAPGFVLFGHDGGVTLRDPAGALATRNAGYNVTQFYAGALASPAGSNVMLAGAQDNGTQRFTAAGAGPTAEVSGGDGGYTFIDQDASNVAITSYVYNNFYLSLNGGQSFPHTLIGDNSTGSFINRADYDDRENVLFTARTESSLYRVRNANTTTSQLETLTVPLQSGASHLRVSPHAPAGTTTLWVGTFAGRIFRIDDASGASPVATELLRGPSMPAASVSCIDIGATDDHVLVTYSNYGISSVWETLDGGATWTNKEGSLPDVPVRWAMYHPADRRAVLLGTDAGVFETTTLDQPVPQWVPAPGFPITRVDMLQYRPSDGLVMAITHGRGVFTARLLEQPVAGEAPAEAVEGRLALAGPNPFGASTAVTLQLARSERVTLALYDARGRRMAVLHDGPVAAGAARRFAIDAARLPAGVYVVRAQGETFETSLRLTRVR